MFKLKTNSEVKFDQIHVSGNLDRNLIGFGLKLPLGASAAAGIGFDLKEYSAVGTGPDCVVANSRSFGESRTIPL